MRRGILIIGCAWSTTGTRSSCTSSDEDGHGWIVLAVDRGTRRWAVGVVPRQLDAAQDAFGQLYAVEDDDIG
jgi:hypothetical protein